jgi:hypothetical protein
MLICLVVCAACDAPASETRTDAAPLAYGVHYQILPDPTAGSVLVEMTVEQTRGQLRELVFPIRGIDVSDIEANGGELQTSDKEVTWRPERNGGMLHWRIATSHRRRNDGYDAWLNPSWGIFRAEDIIPRARTRTLKGASSHTTVSFSLPATWTVVSEYSTLGQRNPVVNPRTRFDQPRGWIAIGNLGVRRETIANTRVIVAAPEGQMARRMDMLALLNWTLPELNLMLPGSVRKLTIVSAGDPMWRGGLSGPGSIFIHSSRPLISENATSTLVHELLHVALGVAAEPGFDWIVEGLAEYYSLELLHRGGAITTRRYQQALEKQAQWSTSAGNLCAIRSSGATTALGVVIFRNLDKELRTRSAGRYSLDDVVAGIATAGSRVSLRTLDDLTRQLLQDTARALQADELADCRRNLAATGS